MIEMALQVLIFVIRAFLTFRVQRRGTARTEGMNYAHKVLGEKSPHEKPPGGKDRRNHLTNYVTWEKGTKN